MNTTSTGIEKGAAKWTITTTPNYINVWRNDRVYMFFDYPTAVTTHLDAVKLVAAWVFGAGEGKLRRREGACALPSEGFARWEWTRETRPVGEVSIRTDAYDVVF